MKVLLIDERSDTLEFLGESIFNYGFKIGVAKTIEDIIPMLGDTQFEVVLTNGGRKSLSMLHHIKEQVPSVFIICVSGSQKNAEEKCSEADLYLYRPLRASKLKQAIASHIVH